MDTKRLDLGTTAESTQIRKKSLRNQARGQLKELSELELLESDMLLTEDESEEELSLVRSVLSVRLLGIGKGLLGEMPFAAAALAGDEKDLSESSLLSSSVIWSLS